MILEKNIGLIEINGEKGHRYFHKHVKNDEIRKIKFNYIRLLILLLIII